nr:hypothetical protein [Janibacter limosus]
MLNRFGEELSHHAGRMDPQCQSPGQRAEADGGDEYDRHDQFGH